MRSISRGGLALLVVATLGLAACDNTVNDSLTPTPPAQTVTEVFSGTINVNGAATHPFIVGGGGTVTVTLTTVAPEDANAGLSLGTWNGVSCQVILANDNALIGNTITGLVSSVGALCARIYDTGKLVGSTDYTLTVVHP